MLSLNEFVQLFLDLAEQVQLGRITLDTAKQEVHRQQDWLGLTVVRVCNARLAERGCPPNDLVKLAQIEQAFAQLDGWADELVKTSPQHAYILTALYLEAAQIIGEEKLVALCCFTQAMNLMALGRHPEAINLFELALPVAEQGDSPDFYAQVAGNLGNAYQEMSNLQRALIHYKTARDICQRRKNWGQQGKWTANMGICCFKLNQWDHAQELYEEALELYTRAFDQVGLRVTYEQMAQLKLKAGSPDKAKQYWTQGQRIGLDPSNPRDRAHSYLLQAILEDDVQVAIELIQRALRIARGYQYNVIESLGHFHLGVIDELLKEYSLAAEQYSTCLRLTQETGDSMLRYMTCATLGELYAAPLDDPSQAFWNYRAAIEALEQMRSSAGLEPHIIDFIKDKIDVYNHIVRLCLSHKRDYDLASERISGVQAALHFAERSRSRALVEALAMTPLVITEVVDPSLLEREEQLLAELRAKATPWQAVDLHSQIETMRQRADAQRQLDTIYDEMVSSAPEYVALRRGTPLSYQEIQRCLQSESLLTSAMS